MKPLRRALQNGPSPMSIHHSCRKLFKVFTVPTQRGCSIVEPSKIDLAPKKQFLLTKHCFTCPIIDHATSALYHNGVYTKLRRHGIRQKMQQLAKVRWRVQN